MWLACFVLPCCLVLPCCYLWAYKFQVLIPAMLQELQARAAAMGAPAAQRVVVEILDSIVSEFSLVTASALGMSWEFHEKCKADLEVRW